MPRSSLSPVLALAMVVAGAACSTAGTELDRAGGTSSTNAIPFGDTEDAAGPMLGPEPPDVGSMTDPDPAVVGPTFPEAAAGPTVAIAGDDGVWWIDPDGSAHLVVEPAVAADYDGAGGLVFQRSPTAPIVRRTAESAEIELVAPGEGERVHLVGVASIDGRSQVVYLRSTERAAALERAAVDGTQATMIGTVDRDGVAPERLSISGGYLSGVYRSGSSSGWVTWSLDSGQELFGTPDAELGRCGPEPRPGCAEAVTVTPDATTVLQVTATGDAPSGWALVVNRASDFAEVARVDLQRPADGWHPTSIEVLDVGVIVNRSASPDRTGSLPALVIDPFGGEITQLSHVGEAAAVAG